MEGSVETAEVLLCVYEDGSTKTHPEGYDLRLAILYLSHKITSDVKTRIPLSHQALDILLAEYRILPVKRFVRTLLQLQRPHWTCVCLVHSSEARRVEIAEEIRCFISFIAIQ
jgi:hypothetical protein